MGKTTPNPKIKYEQRLNVPWSLVALLLPGMLFSAGLWWLNDEPNWHWLCDIKFYPWEFWIIAVAGISATAAGIADWCFHRSGQTHVGLKEHQSELLALLGGGLPLFVLMACASVATQPIYFLIPILIVVLFTVVLICYDEFVFHRKRCSRYETFLHRVLVFGNGTAWLAWMNWCFVRGGVHG